MARPDHRVLPVLLALLVLGLSPGASAGSGNQKITVDLAATQTDAPDPVIENAFVTYTVGVVNNGDHPANDIVAAMLSVSDGEIASATGHRWKCSIGSPREATCSLHGAQPDNKGSPDLLVVVRAPEVAEMTTITHTATVSSLQYNDGNLANNTHVETTTVEPGTDLSISQFDEPDPVTAGNDVRYVAAVSNNGDVPAQAVQVASAVSAGTVRLASGSGWVCTTSGGGASCTLSGGSLAAGATSEPIELVVTTPFSTGEATLSHTATVSSATGDGDPTNNSPTETTTVSPGGTGRARGYISPQGGELSTCTQAGVDLGDITCARGVFPPGPGGVAEIVEVPQHAACQVVRCDGDGVLFIAPPGYTRESHGANPILWFYLVNDSGEHQGFVSKPLNEDVPGTLSEETFKPVFLCSEVPVTVLGPCERAQLQVDSDGDGLADDSLAIWETLSIDPPSGYR